MNPRTIGPRQVESLVDRQPLRDLHEKILTMFGPRIDVPVIRGRAPHDSRCRLHRDCLSKTCVLASLGRRRFSIATVHTRVAAVCDRYIFWWSNSVRCSTTRSALSASATGIQRIAIVIVALEIVDIPHPVIVVAVRTHVVAVAAIGVRSAGPSFSWEDLEWANSGGLLR